MAIVAKPDAEITDEDREFLRENYTSAGGLIPNAYSGGAFFTPTHVARFIVDVLRNLSGGEFPEGARFLEPSAGSGVFLEHLPDEADITAIELDETSARVSSILYPHIDVVQGDALTHGRRDYYDYVIGNPPYGVPIEFDDGGEEWISVGKTKGVRKGRSEVAFTELAIKAVRPGGYIAYVLPMGIGYASYAEKLRRLMYDTCWHIATIGLPGETFQHVGTTVETQILVLRKVTPNARRISTVTQRWRSNFRISDFGDITEFGAKFFEGQMPAYFARVTDIGYGKDGKPTNRWGDGRTQLDELVDDFDGSLVRENLYPHIPSWYGIERGNESFMFSHGNDTCDGYREAAIVYSCGPYRWNELTLGAGEEVMCGATGQEWSTYDFDWQDAIVAAYYGGERK